MPGNEVENGNTRQKLGAPIGAPSFLIFARLAAAAVVVAAAAVVIVVVAATATAVAEDQQQNDDPPPVVATEAAADTIIIAHKITSDHFRWALLPTLHVMIGDKKGAATACGRRKYFTAFSKHPPAQFYQRSFHPSS